MVSPLEIISREEVVHYATVLLFFRLEPGFRHVRVNGSDRSAFVIKADNGGVDIAVSQPSDCMALQRDHVACSQIKGIHVWFGDEFTSKINGPAQPESPKVWQAALHHLLNTYPTLHCHLRGRSRRPNMLQRLLG